MGDAKRVCLSNEDILDALNTVDSDDECDEIYSDSDDGETDSLAEEIHLDDEEELDPDADAADPDEGLEDDDEDDTPLSNLYFARGKDTSLIKWRKTPLGPANVRTRSSNIVIRLPGTKGAARDARSERDCFNLFFDDQVLQVIARSTNIYIATLRQKFSRERDAKDTNVTEIRALIGVLLLTGCLGANRKNSSGIWDNSRGSGIECCYLSMSQRRFHFLLRCLRFDDIRDRNQRREIDRLSAIRELFELVINNFQRYYTPSEYTTLDEQLVKFRGRCPFKMYIPSKPGKYGMKIFSLVCAKTMYTVHLEIYAGKQPEGPFRVSPSADDVTVRMCEPIAGTNRNVTTDNWFSSIFLAEKLFREMKLTLVGTIRANRLGVPSDFKANKERTVHSSIFAHHKEKTLVSYCTKKNKVVVLVSTMHSDQKIDPDSGESRKPDIVSFYNKTKVGVDSVDQMCAKYDCSRNTKRWPMVVFFDLVNISGINASRVFSFNNNRIVRRTRFLESLAWDLIEPQIRSRLDSPSLPTELKARARKLLGIEEPLQPQPVPRDNKVGRCYMCSRARDRSTRKCCELCGHKVCPEHSAVVCRGCIYRQ